MSRKDNTATAPATETTEAKAKAKRGTSKLARAVTWFQEAYAEAVANSGMIGEALLAKGAELAPEFAGQQHKPLGVQLNDVNVQLAAFFAEAATDPSILNSREAELQALFTAKSKIDEKIKKADKAAKKDDEATTDASDTATTE